jgi:hypothetical protein
MEAALVAGTGLSGDGFVRVCSEEPLNNSLLLVMTSHSSVENPAKADALFNSAADLPSAFAFNGLKSLGPRLRGDDDSCSDFP